MIVEISAVPIGVGTSLSKYIAKVIEVLEKRGLKFELNPMGTVVEVNSFSELCGLLEEIDRTLLDLGSERNYYVIKVDKKKSGGSMEQKVRSVMEKLGR